MAIDNIQIQMTDQPCKEEAQLLHEQLKNFNSGISSYHRAARKPEAITPLNLFVRDAHGGLIGGLTASTYWDWLGIDDLWLDESIRGQGLGGELMQMAEAEAIRRGCKRAKLETFSFQARDFYEKGGYRVVGELAGFPPGSSFYWMRKDFPTAPVT